MLAVVIDPVGHQLHPEVGVNVTGVGDVDVLLGRAVKVLRDVAGHMGGSEPVGDGVRMGDEIRQRGAGEGQRQQNQRQKQRTRLPGRRIFSACHKQFLLSQCRIPKILAITSLKPLSQRSFFRVLVQVMLPLLWPAVRVQPSGLSGS